MSTVSLTDAGQIVGAAKLSWDHAFEFCQVGDHEPLYSYDEVDNVALVCVLTRGPAFQRSLVRFVGSQSISYNFSRKIAMEELYLDLYRARSLEQLHPVPAKEDIPSVLRIRVFGTSEFRRGIAATALQSFLAGAVAQYASGSLIYLHVKSNDVWHWPIRFVLPGVPGAPLAPTDVLDTPAGAFSLKTPAIW